MKNILARQDESEVRYYYDEKNKVTIRKECITFHDIEDLNTVKAIFYPEGFMTTYEYSENLINKLCKTYHNILSQTRIHHTMELTTKVRCSKDDKYDKEIGKRLTQLKSNVQYNKLCIILARWCYNDTIRLADAVCDYYNIATKMLAKAKRNQKKFVDYLNSPIEE